MLLSFSSTQTAHTRSFKVLFILYQGVCRWWNGWMDGRESERREEKRIKGSNNERFLLGRRCSLMAAIVDGGVWWRRRLFLYYCFVVPLFFPFFSYSLSVPKIVMMIFRWLLSGSSLSKKELSDTPVNQDLTRPRPITHAGYNRSDSNLIRQSYNLNWPILYSKMPNKLDEKKIS